jgi:hypothetical protein
LQGHLPGILARDQIDGATCHGFSKLPNCELNKFLLMKIERGLFGKGERIK